jgi:hypothetical protein
MRRFLLSPCSPLPRQLAPPRTLEPSPIPAAQVHRDAVSEAELQELLRQQLEHTKAQADGASLADDTPTGLPKGLLQELRSMGTSSAAKPQPEPSPPVATPTAGSTRPKKALIEELD